MIAFIIPYYKQAYFETTLRSLSKQTDKRFTIYIGNDGSKENPTETINLFSKQLKISYSAFAVNIGSYSLTSHWNRCLKLLHKEEWFCILGDDDSISENYVEEFYSSINKIEEYKCNVIRFASQKMNDINEISSVKYLHPEIENCIDYLNRVYSGKTRSSLSEYIFRADVLQYKKFHDYPLAWHSDARAILEISDWGNIYSINTAFAYVRISEQSISGSDKYDRLKERATIMHYKYLLRQFIRLRIDNNDPVIKSIERRYCNAKKEIGLFFHIVAYYFVLNDIKGIYHFFNKIYACRR